MLKAQPGALFYALKSKVLAKADFWFMINGCIL